MKTKPSVKIFLAALSALGFFPAWAAPAPAGDFLTVSPADVHPAGRVDADTEWYATAREFFFVNTDFKNDAYRDGVAPLFLPDGVRIRALAVAFLDRGCGVNQALRVILLRQRLADGAIEKMAEVDTSPLLIDPARRVLVDETIANGAVDNDAYSYSLLLQFGNIKRDRVRFHGATITFE